MLTAQTRKPSYKFKQCPKKKKNKREINLEKIRKRNILYDSFSLWKGHSYKVILFVLMIILFSIDLLKVFFFGVNIY